MKKGMIFDIKRYAIHDGPGIRTTVFFKGCPLRCQWCHNPEGQLGEQEIVWHRSRCPEDCKACLSFCPQEALDKKGRVLTIDRSKCDLCGKCQEICAYEALELIGREVLVREVMEEVEKDRIFFENSGGGVTFSGGEPLMQPEFLGELIDECHERSIPVTVDTCGYASPDILRRISEKDPLILYDVKIIDEERHKAHTGVSNEIILENLKILAKSGKDVVARIPLIRGINDDDRNIHKTAEFLFSLKSIKQINLLPFHKGGLDKYRRLGRKGPRPSFKPSTHKRIEKIKKIFEDYGFSVKVGG